MKKKILSLLLAIVLFIPVFAKADMIKPRIYYTDKTVVGGIVKETVVLYDEGFTFNDLTVTYDANYLYIDKSDVKVILMGKNILEDANNGTVELSEGKVTVSVKNVPKIDLGIDGDLAVNSTAYYVELSFKALKEGNSEIKTEQNTSFYPTIAKVAVKGGNEEAKPEEKKEEVKPAKEEKKNKDLIMFISLGANAVLLIALILVAVKKRKVKESE